MKTKIIISEILKSKGITPTSKYHDYDYLYKTIIEVIKTACDDTVELCNNSSEVEVLGYNDYKVNEQSILNVKNKITK
jgi:hypothetical protein